MCMVLSTRRLLHVSATEREWFTTVRWVPGGRCYPDQERRFSFFGTAAREYICDSVREALEPHLLLKEYLQFLIIVPTKATR